MHFLTRNVLGKTEHTVFYDSQIMSHRYPRAKDRRSSSESRNKSIDVQLISDIRLRTSFYFLIKQFALFYFESFESKRLVRPSDVEGDTSALQSDHAFAACTSCS